MKNRIQKRRALLGRMLSFVMLGGLVLSLVSGSVSPAFAVDNNFAWEAVTKDVIWAYDTAQSADGTRAIALGSGGAFMSSDGGATWNPVTTMPQGVSWSQVEMSANGMTIVASSSSVLYYSTDGGATWTLGAALPAGAGYGFDVIAMSSDGSTLAIATSNFIYTSTDNGSSWVQQAGSGSGAVGVAPQYAEVIVSGDGSRMIAGSSPWSNTGVYTSSDSGVTWTRHAIYSTNRLNSFELADSGTTAIARSNVDSLLYVSSDSGATWTAHPDNIVMYHGLVSDSGMTAIVINSTDRYISNDSGVTWTATAAPSMAADSNNMSGSTDFSKLVLTDPNTGHVYQSADGGLTWEIAVLQGAQSWTDMDVSADGESIVVTTVDGQVYISHDRGGTWQMHELDSGADFLGVSMSADGNKIVLVKSHSTTGQMYVSNDGGATWQVNAAAGTRDWHDVAMSADGLKIVAVVNGDDLYISDDGGSSWYVQTDMPVAKNWYKVDVSADGQTIIAGEGRYTSDAGFVYTSTDGGATWSEHNITGAAIRWNDVVVSGDGTTLVAITDLYAYVSTDGGQTWVEQTGTDLPVGGNTEDWTNIAISADGSVITLTDYSTAVYVTTDGGTSWIMYDDLAFYYDEMFSDTTPVGVSSDGTQLYALGGNIMRTVLAEGTESPTPDVDEPDQPASPVDNESDGSGVGTSDGGDDQIPGVPNTGLSSQSNNGMVAAIVVSVLMLASGAVALARHKLNA